MWILDSESGLVMEKQAIGADHPFSGLSGSDNVIAFRTERY